MFIESHVNIDHKISFMLWYFIYEITYTLYETYFICNYLYVLHSSMIYNTVYLYLSDVFCIRWLCLACMDLFEYNK
jgi:hypothetical protein